MARRVKDQTLDSREARRKLKPRGKPYYRKIERGLDLGYRRLRNAAGPWMARHYLGNQSHHVESIGIADDLSDADGIAILDFWQAQTKVRARMVERAHNASGKSGPMTVAAAMDAYLEFLENNRKSADDARYRTAAFIRPKLGEIEVASLKADRIRKWLVDLAKTPPRLRTKDGEKQNYRAISKDADALRRRRATANRTLTVLKAALNRTWREGAVASNVEWHRVEPFENVDAARVRYLSIAEAKRLINAADRLPPLGASRFRNRRPIWRAHGPASGRFHFRCRTIRIRQSKAGRARHVVLTEEGLRSFGRSAPAGRAVRRCCKSPAAAHGLKAIRSAQ
jgi:hypothetical protein